MSWGFGYGEFGGGPFGAADVAKRLTWDLPVPEITKSKDNGQLEAYTDSIRDALYDLFYKASSMDELRLAYDTVASQDLQVVLNVDKVQNLGGLVKRFFINDDDVSSLLAVYPRSAAGIDDGWSVFYNGTDFRIETVNAKEGYFDAVMDVVLPLAQITIRPPNILSMLARERGMTVDEGDPSDYTRRAAYRHMTIRDWKVTRLMFAMVGKIYGFDVLVDNLYCINQNIYNRLIVSDPGKAFEIPAGSGKYFTTIEPRGFYYDTVPADYVAADESADVSYPISWNGVIDEGANVYCLLIDNLYSSFLEPITPSSITVITDSSGNQYTIESIRPPAGLITQWQVCIIAAAAPPSVDIGTFKFVAKHICRPDWKPAAAYLMDVSPNEVLTEPGADLQRLKERMFNKLIKYVPIHIRLVERIFSLVSTYVGAPVIGLTTGQKHVYKTGTGGLFTTAFYDIIPADVQPADQGVFEPSATVVVIP